MNAIVTLILVVWFVMAAMALWAMLGEYVLSKVNKDQLEGLAEYGPLGSWLTLLLWPASLFFFLRYCAPPKRSNH